MRKILLDCGAHCGCSRRIFVRDRDPAQEYEIYSFEPDPSFNQYCPNLINKAVWIEHNFLPFFKVGTTGGSSLSPIKAKYMISKKHHVVAIKVECIDLNQFILDNFSPQDYIVCKIDVEGAEYAVLEHLINKGSINYFDEISVEFHGEKVGHTVEDGTILKQKILEVCGLEVQDWSAMKAGMCIKHTKGKNIWA